MAVAGRPGGWFHVFCQITLGGGHSQVDFCYSPGGVNLSFLPQHPGGSIFLSLPLGAPGGGFNFSADFNGGGDNYEP